MAGHTHTYRRLNTDRRSAQDNQNILDDERILDRILDRLDDMEKSNQIDAIGSHSGERLTFTVPQILGALFAILTIGGSVLATWVNINNQITSQKVSTDLTIGQLQKDISDQKDANKELHVKMDSIVSQIQGSIDKLTNRVEELDNTVNQLYNRTVVTKK